VTPPRPQVPKLGGRPKSDAFLVVHGWLVGQLVTAAAGSHSWVSLPLHAGLQVDDDTLSIDAAQQTEPSGQFAALPHCSVTTVVSMLPELFPVPGLFPAPPVLLPVPVGGLPAPMGEGQLGPTTHEYDGPLPTSITQQLSAGILHVAEPQGRLEVVPPGCASTPGPLPPSATTDPVGPRARGGVPPSVPPLTGAVAPPQAQAHPTRRTRAVRLIIGISLSRTGRRRRLCGYWLARPPFFKKTPPSGRHLPAATCRLGGLKKIGASGQ
jgi:hypothetical protein